MFFFLHEMCPTHTGVFYTFFFLLFQVDLEFFLSFYFGFLFVYYFSFLFLFSFFFFFFINRLHFFLYYSQIHFCRLFPFYSILIVVFFLFYFPFFSIPFPLSSPPSQCACFFLSCFHPFYIASLFFLFFFFHPSRSYFLLSLLRFIIILFPFLLRLQFSPPLIFL
ncbi:unnamed protein product [Acanthosepion pharaonis]|uniref:Uncharacterized protein n=1 Tax=Acanthosepion pharaonis TaxID=158019 RepID=A0A812D8I6_ACAPH|nr:unnamed protein product [Sepia pharaonis]